MITSGGVRDAQWWGFLTLPQNSNKITFDALFGPKKTIKICYIGYFATFWVFGQKGGQILFDLNFETRFGILSSNDE